jgi:hypothetical protein
MDDGLKRGFHEAMIDVYRRAKTEAGYNATRYLQMVSEQGGLDAARTLIRATTVSEGYTALWERGRLDLTVEALVLQSPWRSLFTEAELSIAAKRLTEYGYSPDNPNT